MVPVFILESLHFRAPPINQGVGLSSYGQMVKKTENQNPI